MDLAVGATVQVHPAHDLFMRGVRWVTVEKIGRKWLRVRSHIANTTHKLTLRNILDEEGNPVPVQHRGPPARRQNSQLE